MLSVKRRARHCYCYFHPNAARRLKAAGARPILGGKDRYLGRIALAMGDTHPMAIFTHPEFDHHEQVVFCHDEETGLRSIIAVHDTNLGPSLGGCRMWPYETEEDAVTDVLRLSRGMTYKAAMANLALGGGKSVIIGDSKTDKTDDLFRAYGRYVDSLGRRYIAAEDVGTAVHDMDVVKSVTDHVVGVTGGAGDPSPSTAHGCLFGIQAAVRYKLKKNSLEDARVAIQGVGNVGYHLCDYLFKEGARLVVTDVHQPSIDRVAEEFGATVVDPDAIYEQDVEVFAPCALGAVINDETIPRLKAPIVAGSSNNQLEDDRHGEALRQRGILYAPDYVINSGGLIDVARFALDFDIEEGRRKLALIDDTLVEIWTRADADGQAANFVADRIAEERFGKH